VHLPSFAAVELAGELAIDLAKPDAIGPSLRS
jgi:hypothetical protein